MQTSLKFFVDPEHCMHGMRLQGAQDKIVHPPRKLQQDPKSLKHRIYNIQIKYL